MIVYVWGWDVIVWGWVGCDSVCVGWGVIVYVCVCVCVCVGGGGDSVCGGGM